MGRHHWVTPNTVLTATQSYNLLNSFTGADPRTSLTNASFGKIVQQRRRIFGRQLQFSGRIVW